MATNDSSPLSGEKMIGLAEAGRRFPRSRGDRSQGMCGSAIFRWVRDGVWNRARTRRVRLEAVFIAGRWLTSAEALDRFVLALQEGQTPEAAPAVAVTTPSEQRRRSETAARELDKLGLQATDRRKS